MDQIKSTHLDLYKNMIKYLDNNFKEHLKYLKDKDKKTHKMNKQMVNLLSNFNIAMCHDFIKFQSFMTWGVYISDFKSNEQPMANTQVIVEKWHIFILIFFKQFQFQF